MYRFFEVSRSGYDDFVHRLECKEKVQVWRKLSTFSEGAASRYMDIDGCGCGRRNKARTAIPRQFCESWRNTAFGQKFAAGENGFRWGNNCTNMKIFWIVHFKQTGPTANGWPISPTSTPKRECCTYPRFVICMITALLPIRPVHSRRWISFWIPSAWLWWRRKRESLQRCSSTATKGFNTLPESIFTWLNPMV